MNLPDPHLVRKPHRSAFTLVELLIAMSITSIILLVMLSLTATVADVWKRSRGEIIAASAARAAFDQIVLDFESSHYVQTFKGAEWYQFLPDPDANLSGSGDGSSVPTWAMFLTSPIDRDVNQHGDVIAVSYRLAKQDPVSGAGSEFDIWALYRAFPVNYGSDDNPAQVTYQSITGKPDLYQAFWSNNDGLSQSPDYLLAANVLDLQMVAEILRPDGTLQLVGSETPVSVTSEGVNIGGTLVLGARLAAVDITLTILAESAVSRMREGNYEGGDVKKYLQQNSRTFSQRLQIYPRSVPTF